MIIYILISSFAFTIPCDGKFIEIKSFRDCVCAKDQSGPRSRYRPDADLDSITELAVQRYQRSAHLSRRIV